VFAKLLLLFTLVPALELALLLAIGQRIGLLPTLALIATTGLIGAWLARREGIRTWRELRGTMASGKVPGNTLLQGAAILVGGTLLLTPGVVTDLLGILLLIPPTRAALLRAARRRIERSLVRRHGRIRMH
jgi:UPF0716 protein FxsA